VGTFISNLLKINARQQLNKKLKKRKQQLNNNNNNNNNNSTDIESASTASEILIQRNMSHLLTNFLTPKIEGLKRSPNVGDCLVLKQKLQGRIVRLEKTDSFGIVQLDVGKEQDLVSELVSQSVETRMDNGVVVDLSMFEWDPVRKFWKPVGSTGDM